MLTRMPIYLNYIKGLPKSTKNISATKIANALGFGEVSVRKDLGKFLMAADANWGMFVKN